jgi:PAS domain S-box-containing protein
MPNPIDKVRERMAYFYQVMVGSAEKPSDILQAAFEDFSLVIEELRVADEELRLKNEELLAAQQQVIEERKRYMALFELAPDAYIVTNSQGRIIEANRAAAILFNVRPQFLIGKPLSLYVARSAQRQYFELLNQPAEQFHLLPAIELEIQPRRKEKILAACTVSSDHLPRSIQSDHIHWLLRDITLQVKAQKELVASEERFRTIFNESHIGMALFDQEGKIVCSNLAFDELTGYAKEQLHNKQVQDLVQNEDLDQIMERYHALWAGKITYFRGEVRYVNQVGAVVWVRKSISLLPDLRGEAQLAIAMVEDISAEKQALADLNEMRLSLLKVVDEERLHLAQELHDGPMQDLYAATYKLEEVRVGVVNPVILTEITETQDILKSVAGSLRLVCGNLRPPTLVNLGVDRVIQSHVDKIRQETNIPVIELNLEPEKGRLTKDLRLGFFRIYQECINNVLRHAQASKVKITLVIHDTQAVMRVEDNGQGFKVPERWVELLHHGHYGLVGLSERVQTMKGDLQVNSEPGQGTQVAVTIPF